MVVVFLNLPLYFNVFPSHLLRGAAVGFIQLTTIESQLRRSSKLLEMAILPVERERSAVFEGVKPHDAFTGIAFYSYLAILRLMT